MNPTQSKTKNHNRFTVGYFQFRFNRHESFGRHSDWDSVSIISEAIHSSMDLLAAGIAYFAVKTSELAPDDEHPYGHGKIENVSGVIEAILILIASGIIVAESIQKLIRPEPIEGVGIGFAVMVVSALVKSIGCPAG